MRSSRRRWQLRLENQDKLWRCLALNLAVGQIWHHRTFCFQVRPASFSCPFVVRLSAPAAVDLFNFIASPPNLTSTQTSAEFLCLYTLQTLRRNINTKFFATCTYALTSYPSSLVSGASMAIRQPVLGIEISLNCPAFS